MRRAWWVLLLVAAGPAFGWGWRVHRLIAYRAAQALVERLPRSERAWKWLWEGAVAPDARGIGNIPSRDHVYHVTPPAFGGAPQVVQRMLWQLLSEEMPEERLLFEMGRICHLVGDLAQPLHTDGTRRCAQEEEFHGLFEKAVDADLEIARLVPVPEAPAWKAAWEPQDASVLDWDAKLVALARESNRDYERVCEAYVGARTGYASTRGLVRRRIARAVVLVVELWSVILERKGHGDRVRREAGVWSCLAVPVVLMWFVWRGRVPGEEGQYPGEKPPGPADRRRSDEAFRRLEERIALAQGGRPP